MILRTGAAAVIPAALALSAVLAASLARAQDPAPAQPSPPPDAKLIVEGACTACHGLDFIAEHRKDHDDWDFTVRRMIDKGADLYVDDIPLVVDYLAKTFPKPDAPADKPAAPQ